MAYLCPRLANVEYQLTRDHKVALRERMVQYPWLQPLSEALGPLLHCHKSVHRTRIGSGTICDDPLLVGFVTVKVGLPTLPKSRS